MTDLNPYLVSALEKLHIPVENYEKNDKFQALPANRGDPIWIEVVEKYQVEGSFELGALKNARCSNPNDVCLPSNWICPRFGLYPQSTAASSLRNQAITLPSTSTLATQYSLNSFLSFLFCQASPESSKKEKSI